MTLLMDLLLKRIILVMISLKTDKTSIMIDLVSVSKLILVLVIFNINFQS